MPNMVLTSTQQNISGNRAVHKDCSFSTEAFIVENANCFLCGRNFVEGEGTFLIFESRLRDDGGVDNPLSIILSTALGRDLDEMSAHSSLLCEACNKNVLEFERLLQKFCEMRVQIITSFNRTIQGYNIDPILIDFECDMARADGTGAKEVFDEAILEETNCNSKSLILVGSQSAGVCEDNGSEKILSEVFAKSELEFVDEVSDLVEEIIDNDAIVSESGLSNCGAPCTDDYPDNNSLESDVSELCVNTEQASTLHYVGNKGNSVYEHDMDEDLPFDKLNAIFEQQENFYFCLLCKEQKAMTADPFADHMFENHDIDFYSCEFCFSGFLSAENLKKHVEYVHIATKPKSEESKCSICFQVFVNQRMLRFHKRTHNNATFQYECSECNKKYNCRNLLLDHMNMHTGQRPYQCSKCPKDFASKYTLQAHMKIHSERLRPYKCEKCNKAFLNQQTLTHHKRLHLGEKTIICDICSKAFGTQHNLDVHKIVHSGQRPFICRTCGKAFARRAEIKDHERIHTGEKPYKCDMCDAAFAQRSNLMTHRKSTHLNEKLHKCDQCGRSFKRRRLLQYHINAVHTGIRPHECEICGSSFVYPEHKKKTHAYTWKQ
ncbi:zinc finger protein 420-like [Rhagoletis pomonella]|uniref:zinc finger protein 420-like n=1 Tax=Rhagoletis pomonella TaxID=28610 RepID=UPI001780B847|nr:zinc finger protein 420-like [Rhagoletis pomonella]